MNKKFLGVLVLVIPVVTLFNLFYDLRTLWFGLDYYSLIVSSLAAFFLLKGDFVPSKRHSKK